MHDVELLAVSKGQSLEKMLEAIKAGQRSFGESYVQEALDKIERLSAFDVNWHFIGRIQSNKTRDIATHFDWVHSVARADIAQRLNQHRGQQQAPLNVCLQVNISEEASKSGVVLHDVLPLARLIVSLPHLKLRGLMAIPAQTDCVDQQLIAYKTLYDAQQLLIKQGFQLDTLSMGLSRDFKAAILAGSTMVRIGTRLFGPRVDAR